MANRSLIKTRTKIISYTLIEIFLIFLSYSIVSSYQEDVNYSHIYKSLIIILWPTISYISNRYEKISFREKFLDSTLKLIISSIIITFIYGFLATILDLFKIYQEEYRIAYSYSFLLNTLSLNFIFCILLKFLVNFSSQKVNKVKKWFYIGSDENLKEINKTISKSPYNKEILVEKLSLSEINKISNSEIIIDHEKNIGEDFYSLVDRNIEKILRLYTIEDWYEKTFERIPIDLFTLENIYQIKQKSSKNDISNKIKRIGDISLSFLILIFSIPFIVLICFFIWLEDKGPILYSQNRVGLNGKIFKIYKFRSMNINAENEGIKWASKNDPRTTFVGKILRKTRFDEIPQIYSVFKGEMSLIGPRPERPEIEETLKENIKFYNLKYLAKPGLSGWAQVNYPYGSSIEDSKNKLSFDIFYIKNKSIFFDFVILIKTLRVVCNFHRFGSN